MTWFRGLITSGIVLAVAISAEAGVRFEFRGGERSGSGRPYNFAVSTTSHTSTGVWTAENFSGDDLGSTKRSLSVRPALQVIRNQRAVFDTFQPGAKSLSRRVRTQANSGGGGVNAGGAFLNFNDDIAREQTSGNQPVNTGYCWCPGDPGGDDDDDDDDSGQPGDDDDDDDGGQTGGGDDDDDDDGGGEGGGPDPSVVPEPGSFALWALAGALLIGATRRKTIES